MSNTEQTKTILIRTSMRSRTIRKLLAAVFNGGNPSETSFTALKIDFNAGSPLLIANSFRRAGMLWVSRLE